MQSTVFTELTASQEANLSGGGYGYKEWDKKKWDKDEDNKKDDDKDKHKKYGGKYYKFYFDFSFFYGKGKKY